MRVPGSSVFAVERAIAGQNLKGYRRDMKRKRDQYRQAVVVKHNVISFAFTGQSCTLWRMLIRCIATVNGLHIMPIQPSLMVVIRQVSYAKSAESNAFKFVALVDTDSALPIQR